MRLPRDVDGQALARALLSLGYETDRQSGSHIRLTTQRGGEHHVTVPAHKPLKVGTLAAILGEVAAHFDLTREELQDRLFN